MFSKVFLCLGDFNNNNNYIYIALYTKNKFLSASQKTNIKISKQMGKLKLDIQ